MKSCPRCGMELQDNEKVCSNCRTELTAALLDTGSSRQLTSNKALTSLVLGLITLFFPPAFIGALVFGHVARREIKRRPSELKGKGIALAGLVLGYFYLAVIAIGIVALSTFLHNQRQIEEQQERSIVSCLRELHTTAGKYYASHSTGYAPTLAALNPVAEDKNLDADFKDELIRASWYTSGINFGYAIKYVPISTKHDGFSDAYTIHADPFRGDSSRRAHFYIDETGILRSEIGKEAGQSSPSVKN